MKSTVWNGVALAAVWCVAASAYLGASGARVTLHAQQRPPTRDAESAGLDVIPLRPNLYMIAGAGGNITVQVGDDGVVVVDAGSAANADAVVAAIKALWPKPIRYVINTSADADHVGGNDTVAGAGQTLFTLTGAVADSADAALNRITNGGASIMAAEPVMLRMSAPTGQKAPYPATAWPTETYLERRNTMFLNGEGIEARHQPAAHSDGDSFVYFRRSDVVVAGDILDTTRFPVIDVARGGSIQGEIAALNRLIDMTIASIPIVSRDGGTYVIPGHGRVCDQFDVVEYRDMVTIIRDRIQDLVTEGKTLEQVTAAAPARGYTRRYGADSGVWTTNMFVEAVYKGLKGGKQ